MKSVGGMLRWMKEKKYTDYRDAFQQEISQTRYFNLYHPQAAPKPTETKSSS